MKAAFLGTGIMGYPMAERLMERGHDVFVYNRTLTKAKPLQKRGAILCVTPAAAIGKARCVILMLSDAAAIRAVLRSGREIRWAGRTVIQMGTIAPQESLELHRKMTEKGAEYFECPVLGSKAEARAGKLILMVGATKRQYRYWRKFLKSFGPTPRWIGKVGQAAALKLALNQLIGSLAAAFTVSLGIVRNRGIGADLFMDVLRQSALYAPLFDKKLPRWLKRNYTDANFPVKHLLKDLRLILRETKRLGLNAPHLGGIKAVFEDTVALGLKEQDYSALWESVNPVHHSHGKR